MPVGRLDASSHLRLPVGGVRCSPSSPRHLLSLGAGARVVVALDGVDGAGKTVLGRELAAVVAAAPRGAPGLGRRLPPPARSQRYAHGRTAETFYRDSYDHDAIRRAAGRPFRAGEPWVRAVHDVEREVLVDPVPEPAAGLARCSWSTGSSCTAPSCADLWDASVWLHVPFEVSSRAATPGSATVDADAADPASAVNARYVGGQRLYLAEVDPARARPGCSTTPTSRAPVLTGSAAALDRVARPTASG